MLQQQGKPRVKYSEFITLQVPHEPMLSDFTKGSVAWIIQRYVDDMASLRPLGESHGYIMRRLQRLPIGKKRASALRKQDVIEFCRELRKTIIPATINQYVGYLSGALKYAPSAWDDCDDVSDAAIAAAKPFLVKHQLVGKSRPRERRPTADELERLLAYFDEYAKRPKAKIPMRAIVEFSLYSARRISETCRLRWGDVNFEDRTCIVRDMKDPKHKKGNDHEFPLLGRAWDIVMAQPRLTNDPAERIFPYVAKSCGASYITAKKELGIKDLRLHDNRREAASRLLEGHSSRKYSVPEVMVVTGHKAPAMLLRVYTKLHAKDLHEKP